MGDVSAKDGSQETLVNLAGLLVGLVVTPWINGDQVRSERLNLVQIPQTGKPDVKDPRILFTTVYEDFFTLSLLIKIGYKRSKYFVYYRLQGIFSPGPDPVCFFVWFFLCSALRKMS